MVQDGLDVPLIPLDQAPRSGQARGTCPSLARQGGHANGILPRSTPDSVAGTEEVASQLELVQGAYSLARSMAPTGLMAKRQRMLPRPRNLTDSYCHRKLLASFQTATACALVALCVKSVTLPDRTCTRTPRLPYCSTALPVAQGKKSLAAPRHSHGTAYGTAENMTVPLLRLPDSSLLPPLQEGTDVH